VIADVDVSVPASLIGDPTRAAFLTALSEGQPLSAGELARRAGVTASTASIQLAKLVEAGLLSVEPNGRQRYYSLDDPALAAALEALALIAPVKPARSLKQAQIGAGRWRGAASTGASGATISPAPSAPPLRRASSSSAGSSG
jgi:DNA-binding transcriptional ArsR family regulator